MTISGDKRFELLSGPFPAVENLLVLEGLPRIRTSGGSGQRRHPPGIIGPQGPAPRFALLPQPKSRWRAFATSILTQTAGLLVLLFVSIFIPKALPVHEYETIALLPPQALVLYPDPTPAPPPRVKLPRPKPEELKQPVQLRAPRLVAPAPVAALAPEIKTLFHPMPVIETPRPPKLRPEVRTGVLDAGKIPLPEVKQPPARVQTGGFGNPLGQAGVARPGRLTVDRAGSFDLPSGSGLGNGTGGSKGAPAIVANAGFGKAAGAAPATAAAAGSGVRTGAFGDARAPQETARKADAPAKPATVPVEILSKPKPAYTEEARRLRKEGEVLLDVIFTAGGEVRVLRVIQGLGYGLDESAVAAAKQVRFRPAQRDGQPVDSTAKLHILFELAY